MSGTVHPILSRALAPCRHPPGGDSRPLRGRQVLLTTSIAAAAGLVMIALKDVVLLHLH